MAIPLALAALWAFGWFVLPFLVPLPAGLGTEPAASPVLLDRHGEPIRRLTLDDFSRSEPVTLADLPPDFIACTLAAEDKRFFQHGGVDLLATCRAVRDLVAHRRVVSGASTITQQLVKISSPPTSRGLMAKIRETLGARRLEMTWTKEQILTAYFNRLDYGNRRRGPMEAARHLLQKPLADLSLGECALLAGLPQAPTRLNPLKRPDQAIARRNVVLGRLAKAGATPADRISAAIGEQPGLRPLEEKPVAPWLSPPVGSEGHDLQTTLDLPLQRDVETIVREELAALRGANLRHAAVVVIDNATGDILALVSSGNWNDPRGGQINGALAPRSPGSTLKPFTYLLSFQSTGRYPGSIVADIPTRFRTPEGLNLPGNFDHTHRGPVSIRTALACSLNVPAIRELNDLGGPEPLYHLLTDLGLTTLDERPDHYGLGLTIGNAPVRLLELTNAYATLARGGMYFPPRLFLSTPQEEPRRAFDARCAWLVADILSDADARAPSFGRHGPLELPFKCGAKTGTSSDFHDNWCVGFTKDFTVGVWAGNFDQTPIKGLSGVAGAGPIFHRTLVRVQRDSAAEWLPRPEGVMELGVDERTGKALPHAWGTIVPRSELCLTDRQPLPAAAEDYDAEGHVVLDAMYQEWFKSTDNRRRNELALAAERPAQEPLKILAPLDGITCLLDPELPSGGKRLRVATNLPGTAVWSSPTLAVEAAAPEAAVVLQPGTHVLIATDPRDGTQRSVTIKVKKL
ncbi:transglycosylase domain-containing protein [Luteolibacter ambystomatis]|uniref:peptidoglycan glycosyltransferase n=1 Tax=Luteolibacter ambystomatis TaxID=2824561 RepID=A0A975IZD9_9BACT|nr:transglycosylase domain-containing protein [Luteolibacter ambystomatis]QUE51089.1 transglycosylase domain-containing protein [Luteolibacter ambystomatis]